MEKCLLCGKKTSVRQIKRIKGIDIYECGSCHLAFLDKKGLNKQKKLSKKIIYSLEEYIKNEEFFRKRFNSLYQKIKVFKNKGKVLDVGAGFALLTSIFAKNSWRVTAVEPFNDLYYLRQYPHKLVKKTLAKFQEGDRQSYDVILMIDILEHLINPKQSVKLLLKKLKKDGILVIQTPNYKSLMAKMCKNWSWWMIEDHKYFFTPKSLNKLIRQLGYQPLYMKTYEAAYDFKKNLDGNFQFIRPPFVRKLVKTLFYIPFFSFYFLLRKIFWQLGYGGLIFVIAGKPKKI